MCYTIRKITDENRQEMMNLQLHNEQAGFIESMEKNMADAKSDARFRAVTLYHDECMVGFAMYGDFGEYGGVWLDRFLIDKNHQRKGYGRIFFHKMILKIYEVYKNEELYLSITPTNAVAQKMYEGYGFQKTGETLDDGEELMMLSMKHYLEKQSIY